MRFYRITLQSTNTSNYDYVLYDNVCIDENDTIVNWLFTSSPLEDTLRPFLKLNVFKIQYTFEKDKIVVKMYIDETIPTINIIDSVNNKRYIIPYHKSLYNINYFRYFCILYTCEHATEISDLLEENVLSDWVYSEMAESTFNIIYKDKYDNNIYAGACLVMVPSEHIIPDEFVYTAIQQNG